MYAQNHFNDTAGKHSSISLTPLIDVVFILLLFFMLSSTFSPLSSISVANSSAGATHSPAKLKPLMVQVINDQQWRMNQTPYSYQEEAQSPLLKQALKDKAPVIVYPAETTTVQHIINALSYLKDTGISNLHLERSGAARYAR